MPQCVVIADDLTGANATGVSLTKINFKTYTVMNAERLELANLAGADCVVYPTDSRAVESKVAYNRVYNVARVLMRDEVKVYSKRIDSTLRGNLGSETDALLDALGGGTVAMVVPCFPQAHRMLVGGFLLVDSLPLHKTAAALDPKNPIQTSLAAARFRAQSKYPVASIYLDDLALGVQAVAEKIVRLRDEGARTIVFDSITQEDMELIADAVIASGVPFAAVDPGVFTATISRKLITPALVKREQRILAAVGSVNAVARGQVEQLLLSQNVHNVYIETGELLENDERRAREIARVAHELLEGCESFEVCSIVGVGIMPERRVAFEPFLKRYGCTADELSLRINSAIAEMVHLILTSDKGFHGLYTCGGDITLAVCKRLGTAGLRLLDEVVPLAAYGELMGGELEGIKVVTKGGMVGDRDAINTCVRYLKGKLLM